MVSSKILKSGISLALTASVALLAGCPTPVTTPTPSASPSDSASPASPSSPSSPTSPTSPSSPSSPTSPTGSATPAPTTSTAPSGDTGTTSDIKERATFNGKVYDVSGSPVESATVTATSIDPNVQWTGEAQQTIGGAYVFRNAPVGARIAVTVTKAGYTTRTRTEVLKSNLTGDPDANKFDFGGSTINQVYAIQDEPQVISLKINGATVERSGNAGIGLVDGTNEDYYTQNEPTDPAQRNDAGAVVKPTIKEELDNLYPGDDTDSGTSGVSRDKLEVEMTFSEPVIRSTVENNFKLYSERPIADRLVKEFSVDANYAGVVFNWSDDDTKVTVKADKPL